MNDCSHTNLVLLPGKKSLLRCVHCHLTIKGEDLEQGHCPECFEVHGKKQSDFEEIAEPEDGKARYRCETCGIMIESDGS